MIDARYVVITLALLVSACSPQASDPTSSTSGVPAEFAALAMAAVPGMTITGGDFNAGNDQYEVTGTSPSGDEIELDIVQSNGAWTVLEIQRDVAWSSVPAPVRAAAAAAPGAFEPARVIESTQTADGSLVFELFRAGSAGGGPDREVRWHEGRAEVIP